jgi:hypothetical protein
LLDVPKCFDVDCVRFAIDVHRDDLQ